jgi:hypothetical protein
MFELEGFVQRYKDLIRQAEKSLDFRRVMHGAGSVELAQRKDAERRKLRAYKVKLPTSNSPQDKIKRSRSDPAAALGEALGLDKTAMSQLLSQLMTPKKK